MSYRVTGISTPALIQCVSANEEQVFIYSLIWVITSLGRICSLACKIIECK